MIHVFYSLNDKDGRYSKFTGTSILSLFENLSTPPHSVTVHILHDKTLTNDNRDKFLYIAKRYGQQIKFYNVETICAEEVNRIYVLFEEEHDREKFSMGKFYRLLAPRIFPAEIEKIIYLDSDTIINLDINELWSVELGDNVLAAVPEVANGVKAYQQFWFCSEGFVESDDYFNSGVMVMNLKRMRQHEMENIWEGIKFRAENNESSFFDQDILNYCFSKNYLKLPNKFNLFVSMSREIGHFNIAQHLYHYAGMSRYIDLTDTFYCLWFSYFEKTPWFNEDILFRAREKVAQFDARQKRFMIYLTVAMAGKRRAFFFDASKLDVLAQIFDVRDDEEIIAADSEKSVEQLIKSMSSEKVFIIISEEFADISEMLKEAGFTAGWDYINGMNFLSDANGVPLDTEFLVKIV